MAIYQFGTDKSTKKSEATRRVAEEGCQNIGDIWRYISDISNISTNISDISTNISDISMNISDISRIYRIYRLIYRISTNISDISRIYRIYHEYIGYIDGIYCIYWQIYCIYRRIYRIYLEIIRDFFESFFKKNIYPFLFFILNLHYHFIFNYFLYLSH